MLVRCQTVFPFFTNIPTDVITNTMYFNMAGSDFLTAADDIAIEMSEFWQTLYGNQIAAYVDPANATFRLYDMSEPEPRAPVILSVDWDSVPARTVTSVPTEVAIVLSFQGSPLSGQSQARRRGRIYVGGITDARLAPAGTGTFPTVHSSTATQMSNAAVALRNALPWVVYSPTTGTPVSVANGWIDNSPDTQRRRSVEASSRTIWTI